MGRAEGATVVGGGRPGGLNGFPQAFGTPFGGFKQSGLGREMGPEGLRGYLESVSIALGP
ncbi:hypothetical protein GCM10023196_023680 [Actinoallomurus vinaceus]|uniref:Aldehyde dehydrogenase domain-containing protein n=1 Tax=Actinoallomurus vinaceus TaxID=1080074 RepID=A0ABP8U769_9ACTN